MPTDIGPSKALGQAGKSLKLKGYRCARIPIMSLTLWALGLYFAVLTIGLFFRGREVNHPALFLLRSFLPNWRFYSAPGPAPRLFFRTMSGGKWSDWQIIFPRIRRKLHHLIFNPEVNLRLTEMNLVDHLANDLNDCTKPSDIADKVSYHMVECLVRQNLAASNISCSHFQFRVCTELPFAEIDLDQDSALISSVLEY
jgi:hypothetical protein